MSWFPFQYRDLDGWKNDGFNFSTCSNQAAKDFDALISQYALMDYDHNYGGLPETLERLAKEDPNWIMPVIFKSVAGKTYFSESKCP